MPPSSQASGVPEVRFRLRVQYAKDGRLAYLSHLEVLTTIERIIRRAGLPYAVTQGFSPHMRAAFGPALGCGTAGLLEYVDILLVTFVEPEEALVRLQAAAMPGLMLQRAWYVSVREPSLAVYLNAFAYTVDIMLEGDASAFIVAYEKVRERGRIEVTRKKKGTRAYILDDMLLEEPLLETREDGLTISLKVRNGEHGTMRPEILIDAVRAEMDGDFTVCHIIRTGTYHEENGVFTTL